MSSEERTERIKPLSRAALGLAHNNDAGYFVDVRAARFRIYELKHNEFAIAHLRSIEEGVPSTLEVRYLGAKVLVVEWTSAQVLKTSFKPGKWERLLMSYARLPYLAGRYFLARLRLRGRYFDPGKFVRSGGSAR